MQRRNHIKAIVAGFGWSLAQGTSIAEPMRLATHLEVSPIKTTQADPKGFFTLCEFKGRKWLLHPDARPFVTIGRNHIDPASLRYSDSNGIWRTKYNNSMQRWLQEKVKPDLIAWGYNSIGWNQDMASNGPTNHRQSRLFTFEEYQWLDMPYAPMLPFADFHHWDAQHRLPDFSAPEFVDWCDYVAREYVAPFADDPKLIGYFYVDCPSWVHTHPHSRWKGAIFDWKKLETSEGKQELTEIATVYYKTLHDAIRRYDPHHLILGDRYEARGRMADEVLHAALPYVDVLSFQHFGNNEEVVRDLNSWADKMDKPVLLADSYSGNVSVMQKIPNCIGYHQCGSYVQNRVRGKALMDSREIPNRDFVQLSTETNQATAQWVASLISQ
ncbi:MAG: agarase [Planctomycetes bacterium]|nr:agarase [Planctomycetota bacterium]